MLKRYILFIAMSFLVFWLYALFFRPLPPVEDTEKAPSTETAEEKGAPPTPGEQEKPPPEQPEEEEEEEIKPTPSVEKPRVTWEQYEAEIKEGKVSLENDYCEITLTRYGGAISEVLLKTRGADREVLIQGKHPVRIPAVERQALAEKEVRVTEEEIKAEYKDNQSKYRDEKGEVKALADVRKGIESALRARKLAEQLKPNPLVITSTNGGGLDLSTYSFELKEKTERKAVYELNLDTGLRVTKSFELAEYEYSLTLELTFENVSENPLHVRDHQIKVGTVYPADMRAGRRDIKFMVLGGGKVQKLSSNPKKACGKSFNLIRWASVGNKYFALILAPERTKGKYEAIPQVAESRRLAASPETALSKKQKDYYYSLGVGVEGFDLDPRKKPVTHRYVFYAGPKEYDRLKRLSRKVSGDRQFEKVVAFGWFGFVSVPLLKVLKACYKVVPNYGLGIIFLTILIKVLLYPLDQKSYKSMKEMQKLQPLIAELKKKYNCY